MNRLLASLLIAFSFSCNAPGIGNSNLIIPVGGGGAAADLISEDCEGAGTPSGWTSDAGSPNWDDTSSPSPLVGAQSLSLGTANTTAIKASLGSKTEVWGYFQLRWVGSVPNGTLFFELRNSGDSPAFQMDTVGTTPRINDGATATTVTAFAADTTYHCWIHYKQVAGVNNDIIDFKFSTTATEPADGSNGHAQVTGGVNDFTIDKFVPESQFGTVRIVFDKLRLSDIGDIGSNPL